MRIAHVTATFSPNCTGTGNVARHNAEELALYGHEVHVYTSHISGVPSEERLDGYQVHRLMPLVRYGNAFFLPTLFFQLRNFDIVHLHMPFYGGAEAVYLLRKRSDIPLVITHHQDVQLHGLTGIISRTHDRFLSRRLLQLADRVCFTSLDYAHNSQYANLIARGQMRVAEVQNGVDPRRFSPSEPPSHLVDELKPNDQHHVLLFVGALDRAHSFKGISVLLHALAHLNRKDVSLIVIGKGNMQADYRQEARRLGVADQVIFLGFVPDDELVDYYRLSEITILPSTTSGEAFGLVLLESMACGTPVIASNLPGVRTVVSPGEDGYLVEPNDPNDLLEKICLLIDDPQLQRKMGERGRAKVEALYAWPKVVSKLIQIYEEVTGGGLRHEITDPTLAINQTSISQEYEL